MTRRIIISDYTYEQLKKTDSESEEHKSLVARDQIGEAFFGRFGDKKSTEKVRNRIFWMAAQLHGSRVLDVGCSEGVLAILAGREGYHVTGIDLNEGAIAYANDLLVSEPEEVQSRVNFRVCDLAAFIKEGKTFDSVIAGEVIEHLISPKIFLESCAEVLNENGVLILTTPFGINSDPDHKQTLFPGDLAELAKGLFAIVNLDVADGYIRFVATKKIGAELYDPMTLLKATEDGVFAAQESLQALLDERRAKIQAQDSKLKSKDADINQRSEELAKQKALAAHYQSRLNAILGLLQSGNGIEHQFYAQPAKSGDDNHKRLKLTKAGEVFKIPVQDGCDYTIELEFRGGAPISKHEAIALFEYCDSTGKVIKGPYINTSFSKQHGFEYSYIDPKRITGEVFSIKLTPPKTASVLEMKVAAWQPGRARALYISPILKISADGRLLRQAVRAIEDLNVAIGTDKPTQDGSAAAAKQLTGALEQPSPPMLGLSPAKVQKAKLRAFSILDEISELNWSSEFELIRLDRNSFEEQIKSEDVDFAFLESCWKGNGGDWEYAFTSPGLKHENAQALLKAIDALKAKGVKTVFWNKEDPMHYERYLPIASRCDIVFTTDSNKVAAYEADTSRPASVLPFAASPKICNPSGRFRQESEGVCFAGAYYSEGHDERKRQMEYMLPAIEKFSGAIYDRYSGLNNERYAFPSRYKPFLREGVPFSKVVNLYKSFNVFLNVNTITDSPTMMSRRVYEILATGTPVVSAPSAALEEQLPGLVEIASTERETIEKVGKLLEDKDYWERKSHRGYREVLSGQTYNRRATELSHFARLGSPNKQTPLVSIIVAACRPGNVDRIIENVTRQNYPRLEVIYALTPNFTEQDRAKLSNVSKLSKNIERAEVLVLGEEVTLGRCLNAAIDKSKGDYIAKFDDDNYYFDAFVSDMLLPFRFGDYSVVGKQSYYCYLGGSGKLVWRYPDERHRETNFVAGDAMILRRDVFEKTSFPEKRVGEDTKLLKDIVALGGRIYSADHFNFIKYRDADLNNHTWQESEDKLMSRSVVVADKLDLKIPAC